MCEIVDVDKQLIIDNQDNSGGAQKLIKNVDASYWESVYEKSLRLFQEMTPIVNETFNRRKEMGINDVHPLQIWTSSMWTELWEGLKRGYQVRVANDMNFMFYTNGIKDWDREDMMFYHNAGVANENEGMFFKGKWTNELPYDSVLENPNENLAGYKYYQFLKKVGENSCLI